MMCAFICQCDYVLIPNFEVRHKIIPTMMYDFFFDEYVHLDFACAILPFCIILYEMIFLFSFWFLCWAFFFL